MELHDQAAGHSAEVRIGLRLNGCTLPVAQLGPDFLILHEPHELPTSEAVIELSVDGRHEHWTVFLLDGALADDRRVLFANQ